MEKSDSYEISAVRRTIRESCSSRSKSIRRSRDGSPRLGQTFRFPAFHNPPGRPKDREFVGKALCKALNSAPIIQPAESREKFNAYYRVENLSDEQINARRKRYLVENLSDAQKAVKRENDRKRSERGDRLIVNLT